MALLGWHNMKSKKDLEQMKEEFNDYFNSFLDGADKKQSRWEALKIALDTRKFEIELYWKRASYFWVFIALLFTGYFSIFSSFISKPDNFSLFTSISLTFISCLGFIFSYSWLVVNKGSKYWQENWEDIISCLEDDQIGPLFKIVKAPGDKPHSVTKVNHFLNKVLIGAWVILFIASIVSVCVNIEEINFCWTVVIIVLICSLSICAFIWLSIRTKSSLPKQSKPKFLCHFCDEEHNQNNKSDQSD